MKTVLASSSPRRAALLKQVNLRFMIDPSDIDENSGSHNSPSEMVQTLSSRKGRDVSSRHENSLIIAADTIVCLDDEILEKPADKQEAAIMLGRLSNNSHQVYTGVYVGRTNSESKIIGDFTFFERTNVTFSALSDREIDHYIDTGSPFDKAGGYGIQDDLGSLFVKKVEGDYYNVVGFPLNSFYQHLKKYMPRAQQSLFF